jgi:phosphomannomutase
MRLTTGFIIFVLSNSQNIIQQQMTLIKSISGIRGTIGGPSGDALTPDDLVRFTAAFATFLKKRKPSGTLNIILGRDARVSGPMVSRIVSGTLEAMGVNVTDIGLTTTPTAEVAVTHLKADGGIILTASHNPAQWNALKLLNEKGEFISADDGEELLMIAQNADYQYATYDKIGHIDFDDSMIDKHIEMVLSLPLVNIEAIKKAKFSVAIDAVNSTGGIAIPKLLKALGVETVYQLHCEPTGLFAHNPEPLPENLVEISSAVVAHKADLGIVVDPDVDRLALVCEDGEMFGEEYTLVAVADYVLKHTGGNTVSNLSSTRALRDITEKAGYRHQASAVGEVNVVELMKANKAIIGGEGNGGVIYPELHYGRDALVGIALFLSHLALAGVSMTKLRQSYPSYFMSKNKIQLVDGVDADAILSSMEKLYGEYPVKTIDGVWIDLGKEWVHLRKSNTEPIIRIYTESDHQEKASVLAQNIIEQIKGLSK